MNITTQDGVSMNILEVPLYKQILKNIEVYKKAIKESGFANEAEFLKDVKKKTAETKAELLEQMDVLPSFMLGFIEAMEQKILLDAKHDSCFIDLERWEAIKKTADTKNLSYMEQFPYEKTIYFDKNGNLAAHSKYEFPVESTEKINQNTQKK